MRALWIAWLSAWLMVGVVPARASEFAPLTATDIREALWMVFSPTGALADDVYMLPARYWIEDRFSGAWLSFKSSLSPWSPEDNDCDDLARAAAFFAQFLHRNTTNRPAGTALAFGEFWFNRDLGGGHAVNFFLCRNSGKVTVEFFEPATGQVVQLSPTEIYSCRSWRL
jgi:hypothetical protein